MHGLIRWFTKNDVAANLLMGFILLWGILALKNRIVLEVFPQIDLDIVQIAVPYLGSTPEESEEGVVIRIEEAIQDLTGIKEIRSRAMEGAGIVDVEISKGYDPRELLDDIKNRVDGISTFPDEIEAPKFSVLQINREVISIVIAGSLSEKELRKLGERVRDDVSALPGITQVELTEVRNYEISIEIAENTLNEYGLSFSKIAGIVHKSSLDLPAGSIKSDRGEILLRTKSQAYTKEDFEKIPIISRDDGSYVTLGDIATIRDDFEEDQLVARYNGKPCVMIDVYRVGDQNAIAISKAVKNYIKSAQETMPEGVEMSYWRDRSRIIKSRLNTLSRSALQGSLLVFLVLAIFLRFKVALWVCIGIPVSFMGAIGLMPDLGVTVNIVSVFAFILVLGIVVDDAIVTGENIFTRLKTISDPTEAAITGTQEISIPVTFGILTTVAAFLPMMFMGGIRGELYAQIAMIVIPVLLFSLIESKLILPAHLKHMRIKNGDEDSNNIFNHMQQKASAGLISFIDRYYQPLLERALNRRILTLSIFLGVTVIFFTIVYSGHMRFLPFPRVPSEVARAYLKMPLGTPFHVTKDRIDQITKAAEELQQEYIDPKTSRSVIENILSTTGSSLGKSGDPNQGRVMFEISPPEERTINVTSYELVREWRKRIGTLIGVKELNFRAEIHRGGDPINVRLSGQNFDKISKISEKIKTRLREYPGIFDITDTYDEGKEEIKLFIKPRAHLLGLSSSDLGHQVRDSFYGHEIQRIQRGRDEIKVMVRYPREERQSVKHLDSMTIRTESGTEVPFSDVAKAQIGQGFSTIQRIDRNRTLNISADINKEAVDIRTVYSDLRIFLEKIIRENPGVQYSFEGEAKEERESFDGLFTGAIFALFGIYSLLAIPFRSYIQPFIVMSVIPFGLVGAILGHMIMRLPLSIFSIFGMLALSGVVVNDSLVLVDFINRKRRNGVDIMEAVKTSGAARFRAILLTSLTTFAGLTPLLLEKSTQAQFLIPMAVSLGFGVLFATFVTLILVPVNYLLLDDILKITSFKKE